MLTYQFDPLLLHANPMHNPTHPYGGNRHQSQYEPQAARFLRHSFSVMVTIEATMSKRRTFQEWDVKPLHGRSLGPFECEITASRSEPTEDRRGRS